jgi:hypothetical protein
MSIQTLQDLKSGALLGTKAIKLSCNLKIFPHEIFDLSETLEILDLSNNELEQLPLDIGRLKHLKIAFFSQNKFTIYPQQLSNCMDLEMIGFKSNHITDIPEKSFNKALKWLILTDNKIKKLPDCIGNCLLLQKCMLSSNLLSTLPDTMCNCVNLELIRISNNLLEYLPDWLLNLPNLAWIAFNSNNFAPPIKNNTDHVRHIHWKDITIGKQLGEGASGNIYQANWKNNSNTAPIAVKIFKGNITSDGLPSDEIVATILAGNHEHLSKCYGVITNHPDGKLAIVLQLIEASFQILAAPPNFSTCTRDVYAINSAFTLMQIYNIASKLASVLVHLHHAGISHGDLYAHNILISAENQILLTDFGAASLYKPNLISDVRIELIEVNAFGIILKELLSKIEKNQAASFMLDYLDNLASQCTQHHILLRPNFKSILKQLDNI